MLETRDLENILNRVHQWTWQVDQKISIFAAIQGAVFGVLLQPLFTWYQTATSERYRVAIFLGLALQIVGIVHSAIALFPRTKNPTRTKSVTFFGDIAAQSLEDYIKKLKSMTDAAYQQDCIGQIHTCARIAALKFRYFKRAVRLSGVGLIVIALGYAAFRFME
jgi:membrane associated rhomboid family serine protease